MARTDVVEVAISVVRDGPGYRARWKSYDGSAGSSTRVFATVGAAIHCAELSFLEWRRRVPAQRGSI